MILLLSELHFTWRKHLALFQPEQHVMSSSGIELGKCVFQAERTGALFLAPHQSNKLALVLLGASLHGLKDVVQLAAPTIPPMTRSPVSGNNLILSRSHEVFGLHELGTIVFDLHLWLSIVFPAPDVKNRRIFAFCKK